jgi:hypothetical protein
MPVVLSRGERDIKLQAKFALTVDCCQTNTLRQNCFADVTLMSQISLRMAALRGASPEVWKSRTILQFAKTGEKNNMSAEAKFENTQVKVERPGGEELHTQGHGFGAMTLSEANSLSQGGKATEADSKLIPHMELTQDKSGEQSKGQIPITDEIHKMPDEPPSRPGDGHYAPITDSHEKYLLNRHSA